MTTTQTLITCDHDHCGCQFFLVPERTFPNLCIEHAAEADRAKGYTPQNSVD